MRDLLECVVLGVVWGLMLGLFGGWMGRSTYHLVLFWVCLGFLWVACTCFVGAAWYRPGVGCVVVGYCCF